MRQSNFYIIAFSAVLTIILGAILSLASTGLAPFQKKQIELDTKHQILSAVMDLNPKDDVLKIYDDRVKSIVVNIKGEEVKKDADGKPLVAENVSIEKQFKKKPENRLYPVFIFHKSGKPEDVDAYILPTYGNGLWDNIWGFVALKPDFNTIEGISLDHKGETPGLGARITTPEVQNRFKGKTIYDKDGNLVSVHMLKGENNPKELRDTHHVDGMSGATLTGKGVNAMLEKYFGYYQAYINKQKGKNPSVAAVN